MPEEVEILLFPNKTNTAKNLNLLRYDDDYRIWMVNNGMFNFIDRVDIPDNPPSEPFHLFNLTEDEHESPSIFSKFVFLDEVTGKTYVEYIEPLVSHLRHPLARCTNESSFLLTTRSYIIPPPYIYPKTKKYYFDAGASSWSTGAGGPSLDYFTKVWLRHGIDFDMIEAWDPSTTPEEFSVSVPINYRNRSKFYNQTVVSNIYYHTGTTPFIPYHIRKKTQKNDYVLFKLDIDNGELEQGIVDHLLSKCNEDLDYIDEFVWEHHVQGNYLMAPNWLNTSSSLSVHDSYQIFLELRKLGIRAHSWV